MFIKMGCSGVDLSFMPLRWWVIIEAIYMVWGGDEIFITSIKEGTHLPYSKHYQGLAVDVRFRIGVSTDIVLKQLKDFLGKDYDVVIEHDHIHIEYDPK